MTHEPGRVQVILQALLQAASAFPPDDAIDKSQNPMLTLPVQSIRQLCNAVVDYHSLLTAIVTGNGAQIENLDMTADEWRKSLAEMFGENDAEITVTQADWLEALRLLGVKV